MIRAAALAVAVALSPLSLAGCDGPAPTDTSATPAVEALTVTTTGGAVRHFVVEIARTPDEQARGLMFRTVLPADHGMLFPMAPPRPASFWMKDTPLSLDIVFIRPDRTIAAIAADAVPYSLEPIESGEPVAAVLEISGGRAAALGIAVGDHVEWGAGAAAH
ncbi:DUF192 domain-containing protein [Sphingomonas flavalba]|uniref:DUF192 domain-containing protein n=1 Tax=Sphingomonas flavalba TaxID=2559804 RepID=UPI00109E3104|nr:DUF192 domain-containing protein [Sphingomonas flavalba]